MTGARVQGTGDRGQERALAGFPTPVPSSLSYGAKKIHRTAKLGFALALIAVALAAYGSFQAEKHLADSPLRIERGTIGRPAQPGNWLEKLWERAETAVFGCDVNQKMVELTGRSRPAHHAVEILAFGLPFVLGVVAALLGGWAMQSIERTRTIHLGNFASVSAIMIGGLASVIAGCMIWSLYIWPHVPSLYTR